MTLVPAMCPTCAGVGCPECGLTGLRAVLIPEDGPMFTRLCPTCGWTNGAYFPQAGQPVPQDGARVPENEGNVCLECRVRGQMVWQRLDLPPTENPDAQPE